ncbi:hypothetical protein ROS1_60300 [Roseibium sp. ROS1]
MRSAGSRTGQGETEPRKPGRKKVPRLDPHEGFIAGMIEDKKDITLHEIGRCHGNVL